MVNRDQLRLQKQQECEARLAKLYEQLPLLQKYDQTIGQKNIAMIRAGILQKNKTAQETLQREITALMQQRHQLLAEQGMDESIYEPQWNCPKCKDLGYIEPGVPCTCYQQERLEELFSRSGMPDAMRQFTFNNFSVELYPEKEKMAEKVLWCKQFAWQVTQGHSATSLFLTGGVGVGKTHLSAAIANEVLAQGSTVIYKRAADLFDLIRQYKYEEDYKRRSEVLDQLRTCDLLVIDDLGAERGTPFAVEQLVLILEDRNYQNKPWIINSNLSIIEISKTYTDRVTERILDKAMLFKLERDNSMRYERATARMEQI